MSDRTTEGSAVSVADMDQRGATLAASLDQDAVAGMVSYYQRHHAMVECAGCKSGVQPAYGYQCVDCDRWYHRSCLRKHCAGELEEARKEIERLRAAPEPAPAPATEAGTGKETLQAAFDEWWRTQWCDDEAARAGAYRAWVAASERLSGEPRDDEARKIAARDLHYTLVEQYGLKDDPVSNHTIREGLYRLAGLSPTKVESQKATIADHHPERHPYDPSRYLP